jgi:hypothetical protein
MTQFKYEYLVYLQDLMYDFYQKGLMDKAKEVQKQIDELTK